MSHQLWKSYWENDVDRFRRLLAPASYSQGGAHPSKSPGNGVGSPSGFGGSPRILPKGRKTPGGGAAAFSRAEINSRDHAGLTLLLRASSSPSATALAFVEALLDHPSIDLYLQDPESGWNALHRALYNGNISVARMLLDKERKDITEALGGIASSRVGQLIKTKDHEGNSPFDVYNASIALRTLRLAEDHAMSDDGSESEDGTGAEEANALANRSLGLGEEVFTFGSNKNLSLGLGDEDDRQFPERAHIRRPEHIGQYFHEKDLVEKKSLSMEDSFSLGKSEVPVLTQNRPLVIQDVVMSKLHSAILTTDPISNLYICGIGRGGRLGLGDENTQFHFKPVLGGLLDKKVVHVALGQNHTMAVTSNGELWTWGSNACAQLGYALPPPPKADEEPISTTPRQVFGPLKKEVILGIAASGIHSVAHTGSSLYCWGKNIGQLALMDADSRSLEIQLAPRRVAAALLSSHSSIIMVSAIDKATSCLFEDRTVCVFTNYGYNMIKFPFFDGFSNSSLQRSGRFSMSMRYDPSRRAIHSITSSGETIAALTGSGDLFTMTLNNKVESGLSVTSTSTTNPAKIKDAVNQPQLVWSSRKDGVKSVTIGENSDIMIATESGAVWKRVKRPKAKDPMALGGNDKRKDFKFQRVPYITGVVAVRSSTFGAYAAVRKDCDVTREQIEIEAQSLWQDLAPLCALQGFKANNTKSRENKDTWKFQNPNVLRSREDVDELAYEILTSTDLEEDLKAHLQQWNFSNDDLGTVVCTSAAPDLRIPIHSWVLSSRSPVLRTGLQRFRDSAAFEVDELLKISRQGHTAVIEFSGIDLITLLNVVIYSYGDRVVPAWNFTRQSPPLAYRYRQIRTELMRTATKLLMPNLEHYVRIQGIPPKSMDRDYRKAIQDPNFFEDGDALLELDGDEIPVHSQMLCRRCPWFDGLFNGRSGGMWLESRRAEQGAAEKIPIDLKHFDPDSFHYVLQHLYADIGEELFDDVVADNIDDFSELVLDVLTIANELMLDRLSQICQKVLGRFVTTRNISNLLNFISPCAVTEFKDKALEYICLQMESMLENHMLDDLDEDLLLELDQVVRENQLARCPFAKSGRPDLLLRDRHPELVTDIEEERQRRVREMAYKATLRDDERRLSSSYKTRFGSLDDFSSVTPTTDRRRRKSKAVRNAPFSPDLRPKSSHADLIFDMDEEDSSAIASPLSPSPRPLDANLLSELDQLPQLSEPWRDARGRAIKEAGVTISSPPAPSPLATSTPKTPDFDRRMSSGGSPWAPAAMPTPRLDLRQHFTETRPSQSALSAGLAAERKDPASKSTAPKMSQKERKRIQIQQAELAAKQEVEPASQAPTPWTKVGDRKTSPWQPTQSVATTSIRETLSQASSKSTMPPLAGKPLVAADAHASSVPRRAASPDTRFSGQRSSGASTPRSTMTRQNSGLGPSKTTSPQPVTGQPAKQDSKPLVPHSKSYIQKAPKQFDAAVGLGLADIIGQQKREQEEVKEAVAKRSLQEIQQEQAFQEWWDQESRRTQEEEARRTTRDKGRDEKKEGGSGRKGRSAKSKAARVAGGQTAADDGSPGQAASPATGGSRGRPRQNRGTKA